MCHGFLKIYRSKISYDADTHDKDDRTWAYSELIEFSYDPPKLKLTEGKRDRASLGLKHRDYRFILKEELPSPALAVLKKRISRKE